MTLSAICQIHAADLFVPTQHATISGALASAEDGDRIVLSARTYREHLEIDGQRLSIVAASSERPLIAGQISSEAEQTGVVVTNGALVVMVGLEIIAPDPRANTPVGLTGATALLCRDSSLELRRCIVRGGAGHPVGENNLSSHPGGVAIAAQSTAEIVVSDSHFIGGNGGFGASGPAYGTPGGLGGDACVVYSSAEVWLRNCWLEGGNGGFGGLGFFGGPSAGGGSGGRGIRAIGPNVVSLDACVLQGGDGSSSSIGVASNTGPGGIGLVAESQAHIASSEVRVRAGRRAMASTLPSQVPDQLYLTGATHGPLPN